MAKAFSDDEVRRLAVLRSLAVLDTPPEERFDRITRLARRLLDTPIALVSLVDGERQWFKSRQGLDVTETPREHSFCAHAIVDGTMLEVPDALADRRFADNPLVRGDPEIRFYAGVPIAAPGGARLGTLCVIDRRPRTLDPEEAAALADLAAIVEDEIAALYLATVDELTGIANRRAFVQVGERVLHIADRFDHQVTLAYIDLDGMKQINDRLGHTEGDRALKDAARLLEGTFRKSDVVARLSGDEFAILLSGASAGGTDKGTARLRAAVARHNAEAERPYRLALSVGWATRPPGAPTGLDALMTAADTAMYEKRFEAPDGRLLLS